MVAAERGVDLAQQLLGLRAGGADDDAVGAHAVGDGGAFLEEFRVGDHVEAQVAPAASPEHLHDLRRDLVGGADRHRRLGHHDLRPFHVLGDGGGDPEHVGEIRRAVLVGGRADGDELHRGVRDPLGGVGGEVQPAFGVVLPDELLEPGLVDRDLSRLQPLDLGGVDVDAEHVVAHLGEHRALHEADVTGSENGDLHGLPLNHTTRTPAGIPIPARPPE